MKGINLTITVLPEQLKAKRRGAPEKEWPFRAMFKEHSYALTTLNTVITRILSLTVSYP